MSSNPQRHILVLAEDNREMREAFAKYLKLRGYDVRPCANGAEALQVIRDLYAQRFIGNAQLLTDLDMPTMNGNDLIQAVRTASIPIPITGWTQADVSSMKAVGANAAIDKAIDSLESALQEALVNFNATQAPPSNDSTPGDLLEGHSRISRPAKAIPSQAL